jgi:hypothetical protein
VIHTHNAQANGGHAQIFAKNTELVHFLFSEFEIFAKPLRQPEKFLKNVPHFSGGIGKMRRFGKTSAKSTALLD